MEAAGTLPRVGMWGDTGQATNRSKTIDEAGGTVPYLKQMFSGDNLATTGKNLVTAAKNLPQGLVGMIGGLATIGPKLAARATGLNAPGDAPPGGDSPSTPVGILEQLRQDISPAIDLATFVPKLMEEWARDPATAMRERGMDTVLSVLGGRLGKGIHKFAAQWKAGFLSDAGLAKAFGETFNETNSGVAASMNVPGLPVHVGSKIGEPQTGFRMTPEGVGISTRPVPQGLLQEGLDLQSAGRAGTMDTALPVPPAMPAPPAPTKMFKAAQPPDAFAELAKAHPKEFPGWMRDREKLAKRLEKEAPGPIKSRVDMSMEERAVMDAIADTAQNEMNMARAALPDKLRAYMDDVVRARELEAANRIVPYPEAAPKVEPVEPVATAKHPWEMTKKDFVRDHHVGIANNELAGPTPNKYKPGDMAIDHYETNPHIYEFQYIDPKEIDFSLEGQARDHVVGMTSTQKYIEWMKAGIEPPPIDVVIRADTGKLMASNRRRIVAAQEAGVARIPAFVEIGRHQDIIKKALSEGKPVPPEVLAEYPDLAAKVAPTTEYKYAGLKPGKDDIQYLGGLAGGAAHAGEGGWSPEAIARAKTTKFFMLDKGTGKIRPLVGVDAIDIMPGPGEIKLQSKAGKAGYEVAGIGEAAPLGLGLKTVTPESMSPAQRAMYDKYMAGKGGAKATPETNLTGVATIAKATGKYAPAVASPETAIVPDHVQTIMTAIKEARPLRRQQEAIYSAERSNRLGAAMKAGEQIPGEAGFHAQLKALKGPMDKVEFESIRNKISQENIDAAFKHIEGSQAVSGFDKIRAKEGLAKLLGERGGGVPQPGELKLLSDVFGKEFVDTIVEKAPLFQKMKGLGMELANVPRSLMASLDLSFGLRQGVMLAARHPSLFARSFVKQFKWFASEKALKASMAEIKSRPNYPLMQESRLALTDLGKELRGREEPFQAPIAEKIPILGGIVRGSTRAYTGFANKLRADVFDYLIKKAEDMGRSPGSDPKLARDIATVVNTASGRGKLGTSMERAAPLLNATFFSPRLMASRLQTLNPAYYIKLDKFARIEALKTLASFAGAGTTILGLAKLSGAKVGTDWRSSDFGKIKIGNTRIDIWGGFSQYARLAGQLITGEVISSTTGKKMTLGEGYKPLTRLDILQRFAEYKTAPAVSFALGLLKGQGFSGEKYNLGSEVAKRFIPMIISDMIDLYKEDPESIPLSALGVFGVGLQTYAQKPPKKSSGW